MHPIRLVFFRQLFSLILHGAVHRPPGLGRGARQDRLLHPCAAGRSPSFSMVTWFSSASRGAAPTATASISPRSSSPQSAALLLRDARPQRGGRLERLSSYFFFFFFLIAIGLFGVVVIWPVRPLDESTSDLLPRLGGDGGGWIRSPQIP